MFPPKQIRKPCFWGDTWCVQLTNREQVSIQTSFKINRQETFFSPYAVSSSTALGYKQMTVTWTYFSCYTVSCLYNQCTLEFPADVLFHRANHQNLPIRRQSDIISIKSLATGEIWSSSFSRLLLYPLNYSRFPYFM